MVPKPLLLPLLLGLVLLGGSRQGGAEENAAPAALVRFDLAVKAVPDAAPLLLEGALVLRPTAGPGEPIRLPVSAGKPVAARLAPGTSWEVEGEIPGVWVRRTTLTTAASGAEAVQRIELWPLGRIAGRLRLADRGGKLPDRVSVATLAAPKFLKRPEAPKGLLGCPVDRNGIWSCSLPAARYDLVVSAPGVIPHYLWSVEVHAGKDRDLGTFVLQTGASVAGWVAVEAGRIDPARCTATIAPFPAAGVTPSLASRLERTAVESKVRQDGFFQLSGLAPGIYQIEVRQPPLAPARVYPVNVARGSETFVADPVLLRPAVDLELSLSPPLDWLGKPWHVQVSRAGEEGARFAAPAFDAPADREGHVRVPGQASGRYQVGVTDSLGNRVYWEVLSVESPADARRSIDLDLVTVQGTLALGKDPLAGTLWFGGTASATVAVKMEASRDGRFQGVLPRARSWWVGVKSESPKVDARTRVEVRANSAGLAKVEIVLPATRVYGRVVDESAQPAPNATVVLRTREGDLSVSADEKGEFEALAVPVGDVDLGAQAAREAPNPDAASDLVRISLAAAQPVGPVELQLRRTRELTGKVVSPQGPVAGAFLDFTALGQDSRWLGTGHATTDLEGGWRVRVAEKAAWVQAVVRPPGYALQAFQIPVDNTESTLAVGDEGGTLEIVLPYSEDEMAGGELGVQVFQNGVSLSSLGAWARSHREGLWGAQQPLQRAPALAPGEYQVCVLRRALESAQGLSTCATGRLASGATLQLKPARK